MKTDKIRRPCVYLECVDSTNTYALHLGEEGAEDGTVVIAEEQTGGRGRRGRVWETQKGKNIMMSLLLRPQIRPEHASRLTLVMAMAVVQGIREATGLEAKIKWPNDAVINGRKICGILTEMCAEPHKVHHVVIGCGINVNQTTFPEETCQYAGSLCLEKGEPVSRTEVIHAVLDAFTSLYEIFLETEDLSRLKDTYNSCCINCGQQIQVLEPGNAYSGTAEGINDRGELIVKKTDGEIVCVYAGEVSVRGLYGYV